MLPSGPPAARSIPFGRSIALTLEHLLHSHSKYLEIVLSDVRGGRWRHEMFSCLCSERASLAPRIRYLPSSRWGPPHPWVSDPRPSRSMCVSGLALGVFPLALRLCWCLASLRVSIPQPFSVLLKGGSFFRASLEVTAYLLLQHL